MKHIHIIAKVLSTLVVVCSPGYALAEQNVNSLAAEHAERPSLQEVESYLHSIGYTLQDTCNGHSTLYTPGRFLEEEEEDYMDDKDEWFFIQNGLFAFFCVSVAALAAGLTMGLVSQELLDLRIKEMAGSEIEKKQARAVIPLIQDHHRLLVTLLLINAMANEALPLFLDKIVPGYIAVILSVTLVLFFGEIIPSAIFSGPNRLAISCKLAPLVRFILWILCPLAWPIAKLLDKVLHEEGEEGFMQKYDQKELSALVRIQYEERLASKLKSKRERAIAGLGVLQPTHQEGTSLRFVRHIDTVNMVEGALEMQSKTVADVMVRMKNVYSIPKDLVLNEESILQIYRTGYSRVPIYDEEESQICGIFRTRQIMVLNPNESRDLSTLPLVQPHCVQPQMNMITLVNLLQTGTTANRGGHMAIVCLDPSAANLALNKDEPIPDSAGVIGIVTLENCIEALIQEDIYDEYDQAEKLTLKRARWAAEKWKKFVQKKKRNRSVASVVDEEMFVNERTGLLSERY